MNSLTNALTEYLKLRRDFGYKLDRLETRLRRFLSFLDEKGTSHITTALALQFATEQKQWAPRTKIGYLCAVRCMARYDLKPRALHSILGLLAVTGMRISEATGLKSEDIDWSEGVLGINSTKFLKSRLVPVHPSTLNRLRSYAKRRDRFFAKQAQGLPRFFVTCGGTLCRRNNVGRDFRKLATQIGLRAPGAKHGPRIHDMRHRFAVDTLLRWYDIGRPPLLYRFENRMNVWSPHGLYCSSLRPRRWRARLSLDT